jgi:asparagine synthase (glutamine-hydrolysing)
MCGIYALLQQSKITQYGKCYEDFMKIKHRGPEYSSFDLITDSVLLGFHRLAIMDLTVDGNQPFHHVRSDLSYTYMICNGQIYDVDLLKAKFQIETKSHSDCEIILPLYEKLGTNMLHELGSEFAFIIIDVSANGHVKMLAGRDPIGVRPLFYSITEDGGICLCSEIKGLSQYEKVHVFPPGHYMKYEDGQLQLIQYYNYIYPEIKVSRDEAYSLIRKTLSDAVDRRLCTDAPIGALLSGGLDSSLIVGLMRNLRPHQKFKVFTIAFKSGSTDLPFAREVAEHVGYDHHIIEISEEEALDAIDETILAVETWDITTIRASTMQRLASKHISEHTDVKVLLGGELADELCAGYRYIHNAPSMDEGKDDCIRLVKEVHRFDGLRTGHTTAYHGLQIHLPFADYRFVDLIFSLPAEMIMPHNGIEKFTLRDAFSGKDIIPDSVLWRKKEAFSDGCSEVRRSWYEIIQEHIDNIISEEEYLTEKDKYIYCTPFTKESYYYRKKFVEFFGDSKADVIPHFWMPQWSKETNDPSARTLKVYE